MTDEERAGALEMFKRIEALETVTARQAMQISDLQSRNEIMDKRILEQLKGITADFDNRVVQAIQAAKRKGVNI